MISIKGSTIGGSDNKTGGLISLGTTSDFARENAAGGLLKITGAGTANTDTKIFHTTGTVSATHGLRILIDGVAYDILLKASTYA